MLTFVVLNGTDLNLDILCFCTVYQGGVMLVRVAQLFEDGGRPIPRHRSITTQPVHVGNLTVHEEHDHNFRRPMSYAILHCGSDGSDVIPRLHDAVVRWISDGFLTISGFEIDAVSQRCATQSWYVQVITDDKN
jgi:hypothetical protein